MVHTYVFLTYVSTDTHVRNAYAGRYGVQTARSATFGERVRVDRETNVQRRDRRRQATNEHAHTRQDGNS